MLSDVESNNFPPRVSENNEDKHHFESKRRHGKEIDDHDFSSVVLQEVFQVWDGGGGTLRETRETVRSKAAIPSIFSSPWDLRRAPKWVCSRHIEKLGNVSRLRREVC